MATRSSVECRLIVLSGAHDYARRARAIGAAAALPKPVDWQRLEELVTQYCGCDA